MLGNNIGERIRTIRKIRGLRQNELAEKLHVPPSQVCDWERGLVTPSTASLLRIAPILKVTVSELIDVNC